MLDYARLVLSENPTISQDDLRAILKAKFMHGKDIFLTLGAVENPLDWLRGIGSIIQGLIKIFSDGDALGIRDIIEGVIRIVSEDESTTAA